MKDQPHRLQESRLAVVDFQSGECYGIYSFMKLGNLGGQFRRALILAPSRRVRLEGFVHLELVSDR